MSIIRNTATSTPASCAPYWWWSVPSVAGWKGWILRVLAHSRHPARDVSVEVT